MLILSRMHLCKVTLHFELVQVVNREIMYATLHTLWNTEGAILKAATPPYFKVPTLPNLRGRYFAPQMLTWHRLAWISA